MSIELFDVQTGFGGATPGTPDRTSAADCLAEMRRVAIGRSLVRVVPDTLDIDVPASNAALYEACRGQAALVPCPVVLPNGGDDVEEEHAQVEGHVQRGAGAVWIRPSLDSWLLAEWCSGSLFTALEARHVPVVCLERFISCEQLAGMAARHPRLPLVFAEVGYRSNRILLPLLRRFPNVFLSIGSIFTAHRAVEQFVRLLGPERLLFGTGFPASEPMAAITQFMYADLPEHQQRLIGSGNADRLLGGIVR